MDSSSLEVQNELWGPAGAGDHEAFDWPVEPYRRELLAH
jgi:hypothetical protein